MWKKKLCINIDSRAALSEKEQIDLYRQIGFDGFFINWKDGMDVADIKRYADERQMIFQSVHAPFKHICDLWKPGKQAALEEQLCCVKACAEAGVDLMIMHAFIGFQDHTPTQEGLENFEQVARQAKRLGVRIALENTEGEEYLAALMAHLADYDNVGFCWDTGHEMCYNHSQDMLALYGNKLFGTHLNDNLGIRDFSGEITYLDDLHILPFDGVADWNGIAKRLRAHRFTGPLTFELKFPATLRGSDEPYEPMSFRQYAGRAYAAACKVAALTL